MTVRFRLDGREVVARADETIWEVARREGTRIPHLCHSAKPGYRADGNCRVCMVDVEGERVLAASCIRKPTPDMLGNFLGVTSTSKSNIVRRLHHDPVIASPM